MLKASLLVVVGMLLGRFSGFVRELVLAREIGAGYLADIVIVGLAIPDLIIGLFVGGAANIVLIPIFQETKSEDRFSLFVKISSIFFGIFCLIAILIYLNINSLIYVLSPGLELSRYVIARPYISISLLAIPFFILVSISRALLQSQSKFVSTSIENFCFNLVVIIGLLFSLKENSLERMGWYILAAGIIRYILQLLEILKSFDVNLNMEVSNPLSKLSFWKSYSQALGAGISLLLLPVLFRSMMSSNGEGYLALFNYSFKFVELPVGIIFVSFSTVFFPKVLRAFQENHEDKEKWVANSVGMILGISIGVSFALISLGLLLESGEYSLFSIEGHQFKLICAMAIVWFAALPFRAVSSLSLCFFSSFKNTKSPLVVNLSVLALAALVCFLFRDRMAWYDLAVLYSFSYLLSFILELTLLYKKHAMNLLGYILNLKNLICVVGSLVIFGLANYICSWQNLGLMSSFLLHCGFGCIYLMGFLYLEKDQLKIFFKSKPSNA